MPDHVPGKTWGTLEKEDTFWVVEGHPYMVSMAKRLFPGSKGHGHNKARFSATKRIVGDLSWFLHRFPLEIKNQNQWEVELIEAQYHYMKQQELLDKPQKVSPPPVFKCDLREFQKQGLAFLMHNPRSLLADEMGLGKANWIETPVFTPHGKKKIKDIKVGDSVIGSNGKATIVNGVYPQGTRRLYRIMFNDGSSTLVDKEHLWAVNNRNQYRGEVPILLTTGEMLDENGVKLHKGNGHNKNKTYQFETYYKEPSGNNKWQIPMVKQIEFGEQNISSIDPYLLGLLLGDGCVRDNRVDFVCGKNDFEEILNGQKYKELKASRNVRRASFLQHRNDIKTLGLADKLSYDKFIPKSYKYSSPESRLSLLQGLMDTDGCPLPDGYGNEYCTVSKQLALDVRELVETLGGTARLKIKQPYYMHKGERKKGRLAYRLNIKLPRGINPFRLKRKAEKYKVPSKYVVSRYITKIKYEKDGEAVCISVDAPNGLYVTDHCIVTHNTPTSLAWVLSKTKTPYLFVVPPHLLWQWRSEIYKFLGDNVSVHTIKGLKTYELPSSDIYLIHYLLLRGWQEYLPAFGFNACVFDEIQELRRQESAKYSAASLLAESVEYVIGLSGTPIYNYGIEIYNVLNILEYHCLGDYYGFTREWCGGYGGTVTKPRVLGDYLKEEGLMLRRTKDDVLDELPPKRRVVQHIDVDAGQFDSLIADVVETAKKIPTIKDAFERGRTLRDAINETRRITGISKAGYVSTFVKSLLEAGEKMVLYAHHHAVMDIYMDELQDYYPVMISGRQSGKVKDEAQKAFMDGKTDILLVSLRSATGLNLQRARCVVFGELDWSPAVHSQAEDRCVLEGQLVPVFEKGFMPIEKVSIDDKVLTHGGKYRKVVDKWSKEHRGLITKIKYYRFFKPLEVTHDHRVFVLRKGDEKPRWIEAHKILPGDCLILPRNINNKKSIKYIDVPKECFHPDLFINNWGVKQKNARLKKISRKLFVDDELLSLFGWYLAEGFSSVKGGKGSFISLSGHIKEKGILEKHGRTIQKQFNNEITLSWASTSKGKKNAIELRAYSIELAKLFEYWFGHDCYSKHIPSYFFDVLSGEQLGKILSSYVDGDGYKRKKQVEWVTVSPVLAQQTVDITSMLGYNPTIRLAQSNQWVCGYTLDGNPSNKKLNFNNNECVFNQVRSVETYYGKKKVFDLTVEKDASFTVGSSVVHNCHRIGQRDSVLCYYLVCPAGTDMDMQETLGLKTSQFVNIMGDKPETDEDKLMAQVDVKKHMGKVLGLLQQGGRRKKMMAPEVREHLRDLGRMPRAKEPTSISDFSFDYK